MSSSNLSETNRNQQENSDSEFNFFSIASILIKKSNFIIYTIFIVAAITLAVLIMIPNKYSSTASILPTGAPDKFSDLKSLAGLGSMSSLNENPSALFPPILRSLHIAKALLSNEYAFHVDGNIKKITLQEYFEEDDFDKLVEELAKISSFSVDKKTEVIYLSVETEYPAMSQALVAKYLFELENYNLHKRRSKAKENELYLSKQLKVIKAELSIAEDNREKYQTDNSNWASSSNSEIIKTLSRLEREVEIKSSIYLFLTQEHESVKFDAQKDVPIIQILDSPSLPTQKSSPKRGLFLVLIVVIASFLLIFMIIVIESLKKHSIEQDNDLYIEFKDEVQKTFPTFSKIFKKNS